MLLIEEMVAALRKEGFLVIPTPWPSWLTDRFSIRELEWAWAYQYDEIRDAQTKRRQEKDAIGKTSE